MKRLALTAVLLALASVAVSQQEPPAGVKPIPTDGTAPPPASTATTEEAPPPATAKPADSPLVSAAKANAGHKKSTHKVITNADVKKANGKLMVISQKPTPPVTDTRGSIQKQDDEFRARDAADAKVAEAQKKVVGLETDLHRIEQSFYDENDPNYRDTVIQKRFDQAKRQLDDARKELADARDERANLDKSVR